MFHESDENENEDDSVTGSLKEKSQKDFVETKRKKKRNKKQNRIKRRKTRRGRLRRIVLKSILYMHPRKGRMLANISQAVVPKTAPKQQEK